jgi:hypothetical protein
VFGLGVGRHHLAVPFISEPAGVEWQVRGQSSPGGRATSQRGAGEPLAAVELKSAHEKLKHESVNLSAEIGSR